MPTKWTWDYQHIIILAAFAVGLAWKVASLIAGQPITVANEMPAVILAVTAILAFFKSPPSNPADALEDGENGGIAKVGRPRQDVLVVAPIAPVSATDVTKPDALTPGKVAGKLGPLTCLMLVVSFGLASVGANCNGTIDPKTEAAIQAALVLGDCIETVYAKDSATVPPTAPLQIAIDEGATCGADVPPLIDTLGASTDPGKQAVAAAAQANTATVHAAAAAHVGH